LVAILFPFRHGLSIWVILCSGVYSAVIYMKSPWMPSAISIALFIHLFLRHWLRDICQAQQNDTKFNQIQTYDYAGCKILGENWVTVQSIFMPSLTQRANHVCKFALGGSDPNRFFSLLYMYLFLKVLSFYHIQVELFSSLTIVQVNITGLEYR
jgi:hypothetical protein